MHPMVRIRHLQFGYSRRARQLDNLSLDLVRGRIYGLLGKNGAGKSTLLKNIVGLAFPQAGTCEVDGHAAGRRRPATLQDLFFLPEDVQAPATTAHALAATTGAFYPRFDPGAFAGYLAELDVPAGARLDRLSFGQQKKALIAFALATNTGLLVLDEPTNGLDIPSKAQFRKLVARSLGDERCVIISTHQVRDLDSLIDTVLVLHAVALWGSIAFRRQQFVRTGFVLFAAMVVLSVANYQALRALLGTRLGAALPLGTVHLASGLHLGLPDSQAQWLAWLPVALVLLLWPAAYARLTEKQL